MRGASRSGERVVPGSVSADSSSIRWRSGNAVLPWVRESQRTWHNVIISGEDSRRLEVGTVADPGTRFLLVSWAGLEHFFPRRDYSPQKPNYELGSSRTSTS